MKEQTVLINNYLNGEIKLEDLVRSKSTFLNDRDLGIENFQDFLGRLVQEKIEREGNICLQLPGFIHQSALNEVE